MKILIEQISFWGAVIASLLLALNIPISGWAYILFLLSNLASIYLLKNSNAPKVLIYQIFFFIIINLVGIGRWLL
jgi:hypothetical protein